jgi:hypothetical protein
MHCALGLLALVGLLAPGQQRAGAFAAALSGDGGGVLYWVGRGRGAWNESANWSPPRVPRRNDTVVFGGAVPNATLGDDDDGASPRWDDDASGGGVRLDCAAARGGANASGPASGACAPALLDGANATVAAVWLRPGGALHVRGGAAGGAALRVTRSFLWQGGALRGEVSSVRRPNATERTLVSTRRKNATERRECARARQR